MADLETILDSIELDRAIGFVSNSSNRAVLILHYKWGMSLREIADIFGVHESRIHQRVHAALDEMKKHLVQNKIRRII